MATIDDYTSGRVLNNVKFAFSIFESKNENLENTDIGNAMLAEVNKYEPILLDINKAIEYINESSKCASGQRVCRELFPETPLTESIFLNKLADGMVEAGKAKYVTKEEAKTILESYKNNPIIISKVSGSYEEICRTFPDKCIYWNMEKRNLHCLKK